MTKKKDEITDEQRETFVAHDEFEGRVDKRMLHNLKESKEVGKYICEIVEEDRIKNKEQSKEETEKIIKEYIAKKWFYILLSILGSILLISKVLDIIIAFFKGS